MSGRERIGWACVRVGMFVMNLGVLFFPHSRWIATQKLLSKRWLYNARLNQRYGRCRRDTYRRKLYRAARRDIRTL